MVPWFGRLMNNTTFKNLVYDRYLELQDEIVNLYADNVLGKNKLDTYLEAYGANINRNNNEAGWSVDKVYNSNLQLERDPDKFYNNHIAFYRNWLQKRNEWLLTNWGLNESLTVNNNRYSTVDGYFIKDVAAGTTVSQLLSDFGSGLSVVRDGRALSSTELVGTGDEIIVGGKTYTVVVLGDVTGDGKVTAYDYIKIKRACLKTYTLSNAQAFAADVNANGKVDPRDYLKIKRYVLKLITSL